MSDKLLKLSISSPTEESRYSPSVPLNPPPLPSPPPSSNSKPPSSNPSSGSFPKKAYCPASKFSAAEEEDAAAPAPAPPPRPPSGSTPSIPLEEP
uniref:Uncharacterized protein n=1 Tax=Arundo donax TaxID=35708 RepID=A0A0A8XP93_ARUDO